ncbi:MAG: hypothetical protein IT159_06080 [Bryobacterales bacterium]|nr:hypothetical protein [Bryobacterales bacterium]
MSSAQELWINVVNAALGIAVLSLLVAACAAVFAEFVVRHRQRVRFLSEVDRDFRDLAHHTGR